MADGWLVDSMIGWASEWVTDSLIDWWVSGWMVMIDCKGWRGCWLVVWRGFLTDHYFWLLSCPIITRVWFGCVTNLRLHGDTHGHVFAGQVHCDETERSRVHGYSFNFENVLGQQFSLNHDIPEEWILWWSLNIKWISIWWSECDIKMSEWRKHHVYLTVLHVVPRSLLKEIMS